MLKNENFVSSKWEYKVLRTTRDKDFSLSPIEKLNQCSEAKPREDRFLASLRMTKLSFVIGEFISGWSHEAWMKIMPCGSLRNERANDIANIE